ncbi:hypothetical protein EGW08_014285, partial [Elysia chlorotica]
MHSPLYLHTATANQNDTIQIATSLSMPKEHSEGVPLLAKSAPSTGNNLSLSTSIMKANKNVYVTTKDIGPFSSTPLKTVNISSKELNPAVSKSAYVPILPQPATFNTIGNTGQLILQNSCLQMIHPNGSVQTIAFLHPSLHSNPAPLSKSDTQPLANTLGNLVNAGNDQQINSSFTVTPSQARTPLSGLLSSCSNSVSCDSVIYSKPSISDCKPGTSTANETHKTMLATVIAGPPRLNTSHNCRPIVTSTAASPPSLSLQYLARLLAPKKVPESEGISSLDIQKKQGKKVTEAEAGSKQFVSGELMVKTNCNDAGKINQCPSLLYKSFQFDQSEGTAGFPSEISYQNQNINKTTSFNKESSPPSH